MNRKGDKSLIVGLDIGTSKVAAVISEVMDDGSLEIIGIGELPMQHAGEERADGRPGNA